MMLMNLVGQPDFTSTPHRSSLLTVSNALERSIKAIDPGAKDHIDRAPVLPESTLGFREQRF